MVREICEEGELGAEQGALGQLNEDMVSTTGLGGLFSFFLFPGGQGPAEEFRPDLVGGVHLVQDWGLWGIQPQEWNEALQEWVQADP